MNRLVKFLPFLFLVIVNLDAFTQVKTFVKELSLQAGDWDSKMSCRERASNELKLELLNEIGFYIEQSLDMSSQEHEGKFQQSFSERIFTITAGIAKYEILEETWNGEAYWVRSAISVDKNEVNELLAKRVENHELLKENEFLYDTLAWFDKSLSAVKEKIDSIETKAKKDSTKTHFNQVNGFSLLRSANEYAKKDKMETAIDKYSRAIEVFKVSEVLSIKTHSLSECYLRRGLAKFKLGLNEDAIEDYFLSASTSNEYRSEAYKRIALIYYITSRHDLAVFYSSRAIEENPFKAELYLLRANCYLPDYPYQAVKDLLTARQFKIDEDLYFKEALVRALVLEGNNSLAFQEIEKSLELFPRDDYFRLKYIQLLNEKKDYSQTIRFAKDNNLSKSNDHRLLHEVANAYCENGQKSHCLNLFNRAIQFAKESEEDYSIQRYKVKLASALLVNFQELEEALQIMRRMEEPSFDHLREWFYGNYVFAAYFSKNYSECVKLGKRALLLYPEGPMNTRFIGLAHFYLSNYVESLPLIDQAMSLKTEYSKEGYLHHVRAVCKFHLGRNQHEICSDLNLAIKLGYNQAKEIYGTYCR